MKHHQQQLKNLLIELQKDKSGKLLKEMQQKQNKINITELAEQILKEIWDKNHPKFKYLPDVEKQAIIKSEISNYDGSKKSAWDRQMYENWNDYAERVEKADARLDILKDYIEEEVKNAWKDLLKIESIKNLDDDTKKEILIAIIKRVESISKQTLETLSVYPFKWDFDTSYLDNALNYL